MPFFILHRSPELWEEPDRFKPERWLTAGCDHLDGKSGQPLRYCPFSQGPRNCAGQSMADMNVRAILAALWGRFTFKPVGDVSGGKGGGGRARGRWVPCLSAQRRLFSAQTPSIVHFTALIRIRFAGGRAAERSTAIRSDQIDAAAGARHLHVVFTSAVMPGSNGSV